MTTSEHAERFTHLRPLLFTIVYEILGSATESDDVLQDSYLRWAEVDLEARTWTIPGARMKAGREHRVPLSAAALKVLDRVRPLALMTDGKPDPAAGRLGRPLRAESGRAVTRGPN